MADIYPTTLETWAKIPGYVGYKISNYGRVISYWRRVGTQGSVFSTWRWAITSRPKLLKRSLNEAGGYPCVRLQKNGKQRMRPVHILMLEAFVGPRPPGMLARHLDDDKLNTSLANLAWGTPHQNMQERNVNGKNPNCKLTPDDIPLIRMLLASGVTQPVIGQMFNVCQSTISQIRRGRSWHYV